MPYSIATYDRVYMGMTRKNDFGLGSFTLTLMKIIPQPQRTDVKYFIKGDNIRSSDPSNLPSNLPIFFEG